MPSKPFSVQAETILGGQGSFTYLVKEGQFRNSLAIDPDLEATTGDDRPGGLLTPTPATALTGDTMDAEPLWLNTNPKDDDVYVYDQSGKVYSVTLATDAISDLNNGAALSSSSGNGSAYYDNFQYFAKNTDICRYGRLDGARTYAQTYWTSDLSMSPLGNGVTYPSPKIGTSKYPNHPMHVHSTDRRLYFGDVMVNNGINSGQGAIHFIETKKTTTEGDTNNGSTYNALDLPYGVWPIDIDEYGTDLVIAAYEGNTTSGNTRSKRAKIYFWDRTAASFNKEVELPDPLCSALENVNGVLYAFCGNPKSEGVRVLRFIGGYSYEEVGYLADSQPPFPGATAHILSRVLFGGHSNSMSDYASLYALGSKVSGVSNGLFNVMRFTGTAGTGATATSAIVPKNTDLAAPTYFLGWRDGTNFGIDKNATTYGVSEFLSETFRIGKRFVINEIKIPLAQAVGANMTIAVKVVTDNGSTSTTVGTINNTNYSASERQVTMRQAVFGNQDFYLQISWSGSSLLSVGLPISITGEIIEN